MNNRKIEFQEIRDFGQIFNTGFTFMRHHFFRIFRYLLSIGGPFLLVGVGVSALLMVRIQSWSAVAKTGTGMPSFWTDFGLSYFVNLISFFVGFVMITAVINAYIKLYIESPVQTPDIQLGDVWVQVRKDFLRIAGNMLLFGLGLFIVFLAFFGLIGAAVARGTASSVGVVFLAFTVWMGLFCFLMPYLGGVFITQMYFEGTNFFKSITRTFYLVKGNWGITFGLGFINTIIMSVIFFICYIPFYIFMMVAMLTQIRDNQTPDISSMTGVMIVMTIFMTLGYMVTFIIHYVMAAVHYYNLVERKDGGRLLTKIQTIGSVENASRASADFYDEEEKY